MYNYIFHFNEFTNLWNAIPRDLYNQYWDNNKIDGVLSSSRIEVLIDLISKIDKDKEFLNKL
jgi:hypothetical protein